MARSGAEAEPRSTAPTLDAATRAVIDKRAFTLRAPAGAWIFREGLACEAYPILVSGRIRVQKTGANGREIALYRVGPGETCVITTACLMRDAVYDAEAVAEAKAQGIDKKEATPFLLKRVVELTGGRSLEANIALIKNNAILAAQTAVELMRV